MFVRTDLPGRGLQPCAICLHRQGSRDQRTYLDGRRGSDLEGSGQAREARSIVGCIREHRLRILLRTWSSLYLLCDRGEEQPLRLLPIGNLQLDEGIAVDSGRESAWRHLARRSHSGKTRHWHGTNGGRSLGTSAEHNANGLMPVTARGPAPNGLIGSCERGEFALVFEPGDSSARFFCVTRFAIAPVLDLACWRRQLPRRASQVHGRLPVPFRRCLASPARSSRSRRSRMTLLR
jgi:hypothetical protein